jgi:hypothetical protein
MLVEIYEFDGSYTVIVDWVEYPCTTLDSAIEFVVALIG